MSGADKMGEVYFTAADYASTLDPPPGDPRAAHSPLCGREGRGCVCGDPFVRRARPRP